MYRSRRVASLAGLGFASGLPLFLTGSTLAAWMEQAGVPLATIGLYSLVGLPYSLKFLWAPLLDRYRPPVLGRRRGWIALAQLGLLAALAALALSSPARALAFAACALATAALSATQDIAIDAWRVDILPPDERAAGAATHVLGYRLAMLVAGGAALALAHHLGWRGVYLLMALLILPALLVTGLVPEPAVPPGIPRRLADAVTVPLRHLGRAPVVLAFVAFYKIGEHVVLVMTTPFLLRIGFSPGAVGAWYHSLGMAATVAGVLLGGGVVPRMAPGRALFVFGLLQAATNLLWSVLALVGPATALLAVTVIIDNAAGGLATAAFLAYLMSRCDPAHSAAEYALLTSLSSFMARGAAGGSGYLAERVGWPTFFVLTALAAIPGLALCRAAARDVTPPPRPC